ncbi:MAG TPA: hypothetical protein VHQ46_04750, partial [Desulfobacteria bacterium]|nr:hypothetical protein [Desulfobacteria bacterium]
GYLTQNNQTQYTQYFGKAVECYQKVLAANFDINTQTDMSTAAFYAGKFDIADKGFKTAIQKQPNFAQARFNYGIFLRDAKNDKAGAKAQFEALAKLVKTPDQIKQVQDLLATVQ